MKSNYNYGSLAAFTDLSTMNWSAGRPVIFAAGRPLEVEIGFGTGEYLAGLAAAAPGTDFMGFEQCPSRIIKSLRKVAADNLKNVQLLRIDATWGFEFLLAPASVDNVHCLFPCPWPKDRHAKHRLFQASFLTLVRTRLKDGGQLRIVTDRHPYADWIIEQLAGTGFVPVRQMIGAVHGTKFEKKWQAGGQQRFSELVLRADQPSAVTAREVVPLTTYFMKACDPSRLELADVRGPLTIIFAERLYDQAARIAMVHAIVSEDNRKQHVWVMITHTMEKGWCVCAAHGTAVLPTDGVRRALEMVHEAALATAR